ncbi:MAG: MnhB domain-containing protein [Hyphomonadaceae bacterium]
MKPGGHIVVADAARTYAPLIMLFGLSLFVARAPGAGVGVLAGLAFALAFVLYALVFGAHAARAALPAPLARMLLALGLSAALLGAGAPGLPYAARVMEGGAFAAVVAGASLIVVALFGRAPTLRDAA